MTKITVSTKDALRCAKKGCTYRGPLDRHHLRHEMMFLKVFAPWRTTDKAYQKLLERYKEFRPYDTRYLCRGHHGEIHEVYDEIIFEFLRKKGRSRRTSPLSAFSWKEARELMPLLRKAFFEWKKVKARKDNPLTFRLPREGEKARML